MKIGRNELCPCGSGKKFKKCCLGNPEKQFIPMAPEQASISLRTEIERIQELACEGKASFRELGVFILFSTEEGDGWLLEITQSDALLVARNREKVAFDMVENPETIEVNWTHTFSFTNKIFTTETYANKVVEEHPTYPSPSIHAALRRIRRKFAPELLESVHVGE